MSSDPVLCEVDGGVAVVTLNKPKALNALDEEMGIKFAEVVDDLCGRDDVSCVVVTGAGRAFSAGGDMAFLTDRAYNSTPEVNSTVMREFYGRFLMNMRKLPFPTIAAINGPAIGAAFSFACSADMRIIGETAKCSVNFTQLGLHPGMGATFLLPRILRHEVANYLLLTGKQITGKEAFELGLCLKTVPTDQVLEEAMVIAREIASNGRLSVMQVKQSLSQPFEEGIERALQREADAQAVGYPGPDFRARLEDVKNRTVNRKKKCRL